MLAPITMSNLIDKIEKNGWVEINNISTSEDLLEISEKLGKIIPHSNGKKIDALMPKNGINSIKNTFSNKFGYGSFPLHTDTAFWAKPTRYVALFSPKVSLCNTFIIHNKNIIKLMNEKDIDNAKKSIFLVKTINSQHYSSAIFNKNMIEGLRYDTNCMSPKNTSARLFQEKFNKILAGIQPIEIEWTGTNAIIFDNWKTLHGRASAIDEKDRILNRIYIN